MISAMYENGGNTFHRHLDGHPELLAYPFESQLGTKYVNDDLQSMFPFKYRWPVFPLGGMPEDDFELIFDEETKNRLRRPDGSKFRDADLQMDEKERRLLFLRYMSNRSRTTGDLVMGFFHATFESWKNCEKTGREKYFVGYSPIIAVDSEQIFSDLPDARIVHIVRDPCACFAETRRRPYPLSLKKYIWAWNTVQSRAIAYRAMFPRKFFLIRYEDLMTRKKEVMKEFCKRIDIRYHDSLLYPSWNGKKLEDIYPWGTIHSPTLEEQEARIGELPRATISEIRLISRLCSSELGYGS